MAPGDKLGHPHHSDPRPSSQCSIEHNFAYHPPLPHTGEKHAKVRAKAKELALLIDEILPAVAGREKAAAITNVENAMMWACAGIVRHSLADGGPATERPVIAGGHRDCLCPPLPTIENLVYHKGRLIWLNERDGFIDATIFDAGTTLVKNYTREAAILNAKQWIDQHTANPGTVTLKVNGGAQ